MPKTKTMSRKPAQARRSTEVLDAIAAVFAEQGYHGTSTGDIAQRLGLRQGSLYYYFTSKQDALWQVCERGVAGFVDNLRGIVSGKGGPREKLADALQAHMAPFADRANYVRVFLNDRMHLAQARRKALARLTREYEELLARIVRDGVRDGAFRDDAEPRMVTLALLGMCNWSTAWYRPARGPAPDHVARQFAAILLDGIAAQRRP
jgi:TetR/AcrR family transcriptional regulator, cholesterol catabolism regulator